MKTVESIRSELSPCETRALGELKKGVLKKYPGAEIILFGSRARGEGDRESDLDVLVLSEIKLSHKERHLLSDLATDVNFDNETNISITIIDKDSWNTGVVSVLPFHDEVERDGIIL